MIRWHQSSCPGPHHRGAVAGEDVPAAVKHTAALGVKVRACTVCSQMVKVVTGIPAERTIKPAWGSVSSGVLGQRGLCMIFATHLNLK